MAAATEHYLGTIWLSGLLSLPRIFFPFPFLCTLIPVNPFSFLPPPPPPPVRPIFGEAESESLKPPSSITPEFQLLPIKILCAEDDDLHTTAQH